MNTSTLRESPDVQHESSKAARPPNPKLHHAPHSTAELNTAKLDSMQAQLHELCERGHKLRGFYRKREAKQREKAKSYPFTLTLIV